MKLMDCNAAHNACHAAIDGEITAEDRAALVLHCRQCADCDAYVRAMEALTGSLNALRDATETIGATNGKPARPLRFAILRWTGRVAAAVVLLLGAGVLVRQFDETRMIPSPTATPPTVSPRASAAIVQVAMAHDSSDRYIPVAQESSAANVHVFVLYNQPSEHAETHPAALPPTLFEE